MDAHLRPEELAVDLIQLRHDLHDLAERSGHEERTARCIADTLEDAGLEVQTGVGGHGVLATIPGPRPRLLRADLDALPDPQGARHACGHDGHMAMLVGGLLKLQAAAPKHGVVGLFQPAEEDGSGMARCLQDDRLTSLPIEAAYAFHNVPGHALGEVLVGPGALASVGIRWRFQGRQAHAASPQEGRNPFADMARLAGAVESLPDGLGPHALATLVHVRLGEEAYGTSPGEGIVAATLRGSDADVESMRQRWRPDTDLDVAHEDVDPFPETPNSDEAQRHVAQVAEAAGLLVRRLDKPFAWSEDVGHAVQRWGGALVGLGAGTDHPPLHDDDYEFPDELIDTGVRLWRALGSA